MSGKSYNVRRITGTLKIAKNILATRHQIVASVDEINRKVIILFNYVG